MFGREQLKLYFIMGSQDMGGDLQAALNQAGIEAVHSFPNITEAYQSALSQATENDRIVTFGSFHTVAEVMDIPRY